MKAACFAFRHDTMKWVPDKGFLTQDSLTIIYCKGLFIIGFFSSSSFFFFRGYICLFKAETKKPIVKVQVRTDSL